MFYFILFFFCLGVVFVWIFQEDTVSDRKSICCRGVRTDVNLSELFSMLY